MPLRLRVTGVLRASVPAYIPSWNRYDCKNPCRNHPTHTKLVGRQRASVRVSRPRVLISNRPLALSDAGPDEPQIGIADVFTIFDLRIHPLPQTK
jgi:hypothetical protein